VRAVAAREGTVLELRAEEAGSIAPILAGCSSPAERRR
jgi:hypothetical protein